MSIDTLSKIINKESDKDFQEYKVIIFNLNNIKDRNRLDVLFKKKKITKVIDTYNEQVEEYNIIVNPNLLTHKLSHKSEIELGGSDIKLGVWIYYPWRFTLVHSLSKNEFRKVRLSRNQNLITVDEQKRLQSIRVGIAGLNVGNPAAICLAQVGVGNYLKLADNDVLSLSNLNRFRAGLTDLGINKASLTARQIFEIDPFIRLGVLLEGIKLGEEKKFVKQTPIDILVEEVDNLPLKISLRKAAREACIPVVMVTGNGPNVIIDIERFDQNRKLPLLNGKLSDKVQEKIGKKLPLREQVLLARDFIGVKYLVKELNQSFLEVGINLAGIPQLAEASFLRGAVLCYFVRQIALGKKAPSGRYSFKMDKIIK